MRAGEANVGALAPLSLREIASWHRETETGVSASIVASVPALQRGLVWRPQQIEMLWDSILRGFPIGALVVCPQIRAQERGNSQHVTHHLLDGQQRCNAIALGFTDPFRPRVDSQSAAKESSIVWLDLALERDRFSTRSYLARVTTPAHPWGYSKSDNADPLSAPAIRQALKRIGRSPSDRDYERPAVTELWPYMANTPVPLAWLLNAPHGENALWDYLKMRAESAAFPWCIDALRFIADPSAEVAEQKESIYRAIVRAHAARIIPLNAPQEILETSRQERFSQDGQADISNVEHLFQRLNQQGTRLDGEELAYSLIKAYWPDLANPIDQIAKNRMPASRMVAIGVRAALVGEEKVGLPSPVGISALRAMAQGTSAQLEKKERIRAFIANELGAACTLVDTWLRYDPLENPTGLLPVHITSIAMRSVDVYLLCLCYAVRAIRDGKELQMTKGSSRALQALATALHWFAFDKAAAVKTVYKHTGDEPKLEAIRIALAEAVETARMTSMHSPESIEKFVCLPSAGLEDWRWWYLIQGDGDAAGIELRRKEWEAFLGFRWQRELLLYAQRDYLFRRFPKYDPARKDLWEDHNRPWDYDHLLASKYLHNRKDGGAYKGVCDEWVGTIGNLRAWPFEDNRSEQAEPMRDKIAGDEEKTRGSFLDQDEIDGFSGADSVRHHEAEARVFVETCRRRLLRIYRHWYQSVDVGQILGIEMRVADQT